MTEGQRTRDKWRFFKEIGRVFDIGRKVILNILFWGVLLALILFLFSGPSVRVPDKAVLYLNPAGVLTDQLSNDSSLSSSLISRPAEVLTREVTDAIRVGADDSRIEALFLDLSGLAGGSLPQLAEIGDAIAYFKGRGKPVYAWAADYSQAGYYIASAADRAAVDPFGMVFFRGLASYQWYYKESFEKFMIDWNVVRVGEYKSAVEPYERSSMSDAARENLQDWMGDLWQEFISDIASNRSLTESNVREYIDHYAAKLRAIEGTGADLAVEAGFIDQIYTRDDALESWLEVDSLADESLISWSDYNLLNGTSSLFNPNAVGVVTASGAIVSGYQASGTVGSDSFIEQVDRALDDGVAALVVRVDSPGGEVFASEQIRRKLEEVKAAGIPVVVSMGGMAASGGYWISSTADFIVAHESTITGSIGIYGMVPGYSRALKEFFGISVDGEATTPYGDMYRSDRPFSRESRELIEASIYDGYNQFLSVVSEGRGISRDDVDKLGRGRVYSGTDAYAAGLVDELGTIETALAAAVRLAGNSFGGGVVYYEQEPTLLEQLFAEFWQSMEVSVSAGPADSLLSAAFQAIHNQDSSEFTRLRDMLIMDDPRHIYAYSGYFSRF